MHRHLHFIWLLVVNGKWHMLLMDNWSIDRHMHWVWNRLLDEIWNFSHNFHRSWHWDFHRYIYPLLDLVTSGLKSWSSSRCISFGSC